MINYTSLGIYYEHNGDIINEKRLSDIIDMACHNDIHIDEVYFHGSKITFYFFYLDYKIKDCPLYGKETKRGTVTLSDLGLSSELLIDIITKNYSNMSINQLMQCLVLGVTYELFV